ncbi:hypothetical protein LINGRAHAP2_LOCUS16237 [Linum grandiflorum]
MWIQVGASGLSFGMMCGFRVET